MTTLTKTCSLPSQLPTTRNTLGSVCWVLGVGILLPRVKAAPSAKVQCWGESLASGLCQMDRERPNQPRGAVTTAAGATCTQHEGPAAARVSWAHACAPRRARAGPRPGRAGRARVNTAREERQGVYYVAMSALQSVIYFLSSSFL